MSLNLNISYTDGVDGILQVPELFKNYDFRITDSSEGIPGLTEDKFDSLVSPSSKNYYWYDPEGSELISVLVEHTSLNSSWAMLNANGNPTKLII